MDQSLRPRLVLRPLVLLHLVFGKLLLHQWPNGRGCTAALLSARSAVNTRADARKGGGLLAYHHAVGVRGEHGRRRVTRLDFLLEVPPEQSDAHCMLVAALRLGVDARCVCVVAAIYPTPGLGALMLRSCDKNTWLHCEHVCASDYACQHGALGRGCAPTKRSPAAAHAKSCWILFMPSENQPNTSQAWEHRGSG